ncbi:MAG TPA: agmatine deiminase family protein [Bacteroidales bacterium]|jgi:agmatine deiminase|nr:agmatine deiminase family protein [Bacteroidales bacterium]
MPEFTEPTPRKSGYRFPAEWAKHTATWLSYPHNEASWPGKIHTIFPYYRQFIKELAKGENVNINVLNEDMQNSVYNELSELGTRMDRIFLFVHPTNDAWCRDHGPAFLLKPGSEKPKVIVSWKYNGWGGKYPAELDSQIPAKVGALLDLPVIYPGIVMEGGSVDFNGKGTILTTTSCLLNPNRNPGMSKGEIEFHLLEFYGADQVLWLGDGIEGDDTDGHIDDLTRFVNEDTVITVVESNKSDANHIPLKENLKALSKFRLTNGKQLNIVEIPMPEPMYYQGQRLPVSYANFYIANAGVMVPVYRCKQDNKAIYLLEECFKDRPVIGLDSVEIIWGLGSWHCLSQQEPEILSS